MRFSKSSIKLTLCAGRLPNKQSHVLFKKQAHPVKRIHFTDVKPLRQFLMISSKFLFKRFQKWAQRRGPSLFNQRKSKYLQQFWFTRSTKGLSSRQRIFIKFSSQVPLFNGHAALQGPSPDSKHKDLIFTFFCNRGNSMSFGSKLANSPQTGIQAKESKIKLKNHR